MKVVVDPVRTASWGVVGREYGPEPEKFEVPDDATPSEILKKIASILPKLAEKLGTPYPIRIEIALYGDNAEEKIKELSKALSPTVYHTIDHWGRILIPSEDVSIFDLKRKFEQLR